MAGEETSRDCCLRSCAIAQLRNTSSFGFLNAGSYPNAGQILGQANLIDLFGRRPISQAVEERFHYTKQLWNFFTK